MPTPTYYPIASVTANGSQSSITLSGLGVYKNLFIRAYFSHSVAGTLFYINGSGANVTHDQITHYNGNATPALESNTYSYLNQGGNLSSVYGIANIWITDYGNTGIFKPYYVESQWDTNVNMSMTSGNWKSTAAVTSIQFTSGSNFTNQSKFTAFGLD